MASTLCRTAEFLLPRSACLGLMDPGGESDLDRRIADPRPSVTRSDVTRVSEDGKVVDFGYLGSVGAVLRFDVRSLILSSPPPNGGLTFVPTREGLTIDGWRNGFSPTLNGRSLPLDTSRARAKSRDRPRREAFLHRLKLRAKGVRRYRSAEMAVEQPERGLGGQRQQGRTVIVTSDGDGAIRWHRADDGRELLALQVLPNNKEPGKWDWVLWTPEGFYEATPGAENVLKWVTNHGPDQAAMTLPVSAIAKLHRPNALPHVLDQLETAHALGVDDIDAGEINCSGQDRQRQAARRGAARSGDRP